MTPNDTAEIQAIINRLQLALVAETPKDQYSLAQEAWHYLGALVNALSYRK